MTSNLKNLTLNAMAVPVRWNGEWLIIGEIPGSFSLLLLIMFVFSGMLVLRVFFILLLVIILIRTRRWTGRATCLDSTHSVKNCDGHLHQKISEIQ